MSRNRTTPAQPVGPAHGREFAERHDVRVQQGHSTTIIGNSMFGGCSVSVQTPIHVSYVVVSLFLFSYTAAGRDTADPSEITRIAMAAGEPQQQVKGTEDTPVPFSTQPQSFHTKPGPRSFLRTFVSDQKAIWTGPSRLSRGDLKWVLPVVISTGVAIGTDDNLSEQLPNPDDPARIIGKNVSYLGSLYTLVSCF
jgi:hypothetical protein